MKPLIVVVGLILALPAISQAHSVTSAQNQNPPMANLNLNASGEQDAIKAANDNQNSNTVSQPSRANPPIANLNLNASGEQDAINSSQETNVNAASNSNTNSNQDRQAIIAKLRTPAKFLPLLLIPGALLLYLLYERLSERRK